MKDCVQATNTRNLKKKQIIPRLHLLPSRLLHMMAFVDRTISYDSSRYQSILVMVLIQVGTKYL
jgi:hypothetical protein